MSETNSIRRLRVTTIGKRGISKNEADERYARPVNTLSNGSVIFGENGLLQQDNNNFFWNNSNKRLGIGTNTPAYKLDVSGYIRSSSGGYVFPDGTIQTTAATGGGGGGGGATTFLQLIDTPNSYITHALKLVQVNSDENALVFTPIASLLTAGTGISISGTTNATIANTGILSLNAGGGISISSGQNPTITNTGILSLAAGSGISITTGQNPTITNTGVLSVNAATGALTLQGTTNQINVSTSGTTITLSIPQDIHTGATPTFAGLILKKSTAGNLLIIRNTGDTADVFLVNNSGNLTASGTGTFNSSPLTIGNLVLSDTGLTASRTFTFPNVSDTLVSLTATQTLTNKTLSTGSTWNGNVIGTSYGGTGLSSIGNANQILGVNSGATGLEYKNIASLLTAGTGISISGTTNATISNTGILSLTAGSGISITTGQNPTITNTGVLSLNSATGALTLQGTTNQVNVSTVGSTITLSTPQDIHTGATPRFARLGLGVPASTSANNLLNLNTNGNIVVNNTNPKRSIFVHAAGMWTSTTNGSASLAKTELPTNKVNYQSLDFDPNTTQYAEFSLIMPDNYDGGTLTFKIVWTAASGTGSVVWGLQATALTDGEAIDASWGTATTITDTLISANYIHDTGESLALTVANNPAGGKHIQFRIFRDATNASDTLGVNAKLIGVRIEYGINAYSH